MLRPPFCDLLGIDVPIVQAPVGPVATAELAAAVANAGGLGTVAAVLRPAADLRRQLDRVRELTDRPVAVNFVLTTFDEAAFAVALAARPAAISFALGEPGELVARAHDAGAVVLQQVHTVRGAIRAAELAVDVVVAQGSEAGGNSGEVAALPLIPQVVDAVRPRPVLAAGGIADGRGLAAALVLGAQGAYLGTRFLAAAEAPAGEGWKRAIVQAASEDAVKFEAWNELFPPTGGDYATVPRTLRTGFVDEWAAKRAEARGEADRLRDEVAAAARAGRMQELVPLSGQSAGLIREVLPAAEIVRRLVAEAEAALARLTGDAPEAVAARGVS
jgi:enoyl-[acyl-carrier protein] reductase II